MWVPGGEEKSYLFGWFLVISILSRHPLCECPLTIPQSLSLTFLPPSLGSGLLKPPLTPSLVALLRCELDFNVLKIQSAPWGFSALLVCGLLSGRGPAARGPAGDQRALRGGPCTPCGRLGSLLWTCA